VLYACHYRTPQTVVTTRTMQALISYLDAIARDANPATAAFDPQAAYVLVCCLLPPIVGALVALLLHGAEAVLGTISDPR